MKKVFTGILVAVCILTSGCSIYLFTELGKVKSERTQLASQNGTLQMQLDAIGQTTEVWTVKSNVVCGQPITEDNLQQATFPVSAVNENYVTDTSTIIGKYYKVDVLVGTPLTNDIIMDDALDGTIYERDLTFDSLPIGLDVGDYVDIRVMLPYGEEFTVMSRKRVDSIIETTVKMRLVEDELALWSSVLVDKALYSPIGLKVYMVKYTEPGISTPAIPFYSVRTDMAAIVKTNPNIQNAAAIVQPSIRDVIDNKLKLVTQQDGSKLASAVSGEHSALSSGQNSVDSGQANIVDPDTGKVITKDKTDAYGNTSNVTEDQVEQSAGDSLFGDMETIE